MCDTYTDIDDSIDASTYGIGTGDWEIQFNTSDVAPPEDIPEITVTSTQPNPYVDTAIAAALTRSFGTAGTEVALGLAEGLELGAWAGPLGGVIGAVIGASIAYYYISHE